MESGRKQAETSVEEQSLASKNIDRNIDRNIVSVSLMIEASAVSAGEVASASTSVAEQAAQLQGLMEDFKFQLVITNASLIRSLRVGYRLKNRQYFSSHFIFEITFN
jgi:hypothetical protein